MHSWTLDTATLQTARFDAILLHLQSVIDVPGLWSATQFAVNETVCNDACVLRLGANILATPNTNGFAHLRFIPASPGTRVCQLSDVLFDPRQLEHAEFLRRHLVPRNWHSIACLLFWDQDGLAAEIAILRTAAQGPFTNQEIAALDRLHPHIEATLQRVAALEERARGAARQSPSAGEFLTPAESQLVRFVHAGLSNKEIAVRLHKSIRTVKTQLTSIYRKYGVRSRTRLIATMLGSAERVRRHDAGTIGY